MRQESKTTEFKREYTDDLKYAVVAFANTDGGKIYIGINDDGSVQGVQNADGTMLRITNMIRDVVRPDVTMFTECVTEEMDGKTVIVLNVQRGTAAPKSKLFGFAINGPKSVIAPTPIKIRHG